MSYVAPVDVQVAGIVIVSALCPKAGSVSSHTTKQKSSRWNVGIQGGVGITPKGVQPYIGVGVSYRLF